ncbi:unnamed protein product [Polarella glacialis]|uniref:Uncharacterized protein n=1 Tax=Polarella glacialis TaxID=89957 RepID=A0A813DES6_POLGL|nr:unnamed protein product [Polarella glacialis]
MPAPLRRDLPPRRDARGCQQPGLAASARRICFLAAAAVVLAWQRQAEGSDAFVNALHAAASPSSSATPRPSEPDVLAAVLEAGRQRAQLNPQVGFYNKLVGDGVEGGKRWRLVYLATKNAVVAARKGVAPPSMLDRGWYVDGVVTAVQRFEDSPKRRMNQNGVFGFLGLGGFFFGYFARFKWPAPAKRTTMAFEPIASDLHAFGQDWSFPSPTGPGPEGDKRFEEVRLQESNIFNFFYVDEHVAVAQGASGSVALWGATDPGWDAANLVTTGRERADGAGA